MLNRKQSLLGLFSIGLLWLGQAGAAEDVGKKVVMQGGEQGATACVACHGADGAGNQAAGYPKLAGLSAGYIERQIDAFISGDFESPVMQGIANQLTDQEKTAVAEYYSQQKAPAVNTDFPEKLLAQGRFLAENGDWDQSIPACVSCHGPDGQGVNDSPYFPKIAGQHSRYIQNQIQAWQDGKRSADPLGLMQHVAKSLSKEQTESVAAYFASLPALDQQALDQAEQELIAQGQLDLSQAQPKGFTPPAKTDIPDNQFGDMVRLGEQIFTHTPDYAGEYIGNNLSCVNCHLDAGRLADSAPMWAAWGMYPAYRAKNDRVNSMADRIQGCFMYSMNGEAPPKDSDVMTAVQSYMYWMATDVPTGKSMEGRGYPALDKPQQAPSVSRGEQVYQKDCALCHGDNGQGQMVDGSYVFPALWGEDSYNWGAGMHRIETAATFIHANMPLGLGGALLSKQEAWDVAAFINHQPRPQDPRFAGDEAATKADFHSHECFYGDFEGSAVQ